MEYRVTMSYIGGILSENSYKFLSRGTKPYVKMWMRELSGKVGLLKVPSAGSYEIRVFGKFTDERRPDISNLFKVISDAIQEGLVVNDKHFRMIDSGYRLGFLDQELE